MIEIKEKYKKKNYGFITTDKDYSNYEKTKPLYSFEHDVVNAYIASYKEMKSNFQKDFTKTIERIKEQHNATITDLIFYSLQRLNFEISDLNKKLEKTFFDITNK